MAISDSEYNVWLSSPSALRCILVEASANVSGTEVVRYMSNRGYVTSSSDTPANTVYRSIISGGIKLTENLSLESGASLSWGEVEIDNTKGELDSWLDDVWANREIRVYFGDMRWARDDFRMIFKGLMSGIGSQSNTKLNIFLRDSLQKLNTPVIDTKLGGTTVNKDRLIPLTFGECHNVSPLLTDPVNHEYQVHNAAIEDIIEVRDNGAPLTVTKYLSTGKFRLSNSPVGTITASVQGDKPSTYTNTIADTIKRLVKGFGTTENRLTDSDIDLTNFSTFNTANPAPIGIYLSDRINLLEACQQVASSVGAQVMMSRLGKLQLKRIDFPAPTATVEINSKHIVFKSLAVDSRIDVTPSVKIGYCKNWTVESNLQTAIPEEHKALYEQEWLTVTQNDSATATKYKLLTEPVQKDTLLLTTSDANTEASRRLAITKEQRVIYKMQCLPSMFNLEIGQSVILKHSRFGLSSGKTGVVVGLEPDWMNCKINVKVMV